MTDRRVRNPLILVPILVVIGAMTLHAETTDGILRRAAGFLGTPYRSGGIAPGGFDCSGFVTYLYRSTLPDLPRISRQMAAYGRSVAPGDWKPGDLLFYATGPDPTRINHVAIWYGDGYVIHSISDGPETGVVFTPADARYWSRRYVSARRVLPETPSSSSETLPVVPGETPATAAEESPWEDFDGYLRGDFEAWKQADDEAFEAYKRENG